MLLKTLTELNGASGDEQRVREYIYNEIENFVDEIRIDKIGNIIAFKKGKTGKYKVMLSAHMDEVGFMVVGIKEDGTLRFKDVGGIDTRILLGLRVTIGEKKIPGVIGGKPIHLQSKQERVSAIKLKNLYIDVGTTTKEETEELVNIGDYIYFDSEYIEFGNDKIKAKALDDRVGCSILMEVLKKKYEFDLYACFTVQEEVGLRGSIVSSNSIQPDIAIVIEGTTCSDVYGVKEQDYSTISGGGAVLSIMDRTSITDKKLFKYISTIAKKYDIKIQYKKTISGGNDAGSIQRSGKGVKVATISVPCRYIHSPVSVMSKVDYNQVLKLTDVFLTDISEADIEEILI